MHETLHCEVVLDLLEPSLDGELAPAEEARLRSHLAGCRSCAAEMALAVKVQSELRALGRARQGVVVPFPRPAGNHHAVRIALAAAMLALTVGGALFLEENRLRPAAPIQVVQSDPAQPANPADIARATAEARYALAYIGKVSRHTGLDLRDGLLHGRY